MGTVTITPQFTDYGGHTWGSDPDKVAKQAVITQVCADYSAAFATITSVGNITLIVDCGNGAVGPAGAGVSAATTNCQSGAQTYANYRTVLLGIGASNSIQTSGWSTPNFPSSAPNSEASTVAIGYGLQVALGMMSPATLTALTGGIIAYSGFGTGISSNYDVHGTSGSSYYEFVFHEIGEAVGRQQGIEAIWSYTGIGSSPVSSGTAFASGRGLSADGGATAICFFNTSGSGDEFDFVNGADAYQFSGPSGSAVSRSSVLPGTAADWQLQTLIGWKLSATGQTFAALSGVPVNTAVPTISGVATANHTLTCTPGSWTNSPTSFTRQWKSNGSNVGSNSLTYAVATSDIGNTITVSETATNASGDSSPATSSATSAVAAASRIKLRH